MGSKGSRHKRSRKERDCVEENKADQSESTPKEKCYDPHDPTLLIVDGEDELDFELEDFKSPRALMSCGHAVTPTSLTNWCRRQLDKGARYFVCGMPNCDVEWSFEEVCRMALLTPEEIEYFENKIFDNARDCFNVKSCPGCKSTVLRSDVNDLCVECTVCTNDHNTPFLFCWQCLREWRGSVLHSDGCENKGCINKSLETLKNCPDITFLEVDGVTGCPSIRACPTCGFLLEHNKTGCKYLTCAQCKKKFCFVCLKGKEDCLKTSCYYKACSSGVAPRQTSIPALKRKIGVFKFRS